MVRYTSGSVRPTSGTVRVTSGRSGSRPAHVRLTSGLRPGMSGTIRGYPGHVLVMSVSCPGHVRHYPGLSWSCPGHVRVMSGSCPGVFMAQEIIRLCPGLLSGSSPGDVRERSCMCDCDAPDTTRTGKSGPIRCLSGTIYPGLIRL